MRDEQSSTGRLEILVALLSEDSPLEIRGTISHIDAKPGSDESRLSIHFSGRDTALLTADNGRVLDAIEVLAAEILELQGAERQALQVDAGSFLAEQRVRMRQAARAAVGQVRFTGTPFVFPPMCARDRRLLEKELIFSGLYFETLGLQSTRWVILYPKEAGSPGEAFAGQLTHSN